MESATESAAARRPLRIVFFGLPLAAVLLARDGHEVALASVPFSSATGLRRARRVVGALYEDRVLVKPSLRDARFVERVRSLDADLLVSWFWTNRLPMSLVRAARLGGIGVHPSLLPRHRGPDPYYAAIVAGDRETGVTVHRLEQEYDTGDILAQEALTIDPRWNAWRLARALDRPSLRLLRATVARFARGEVVVGVPQDPALATEAPQPSEDDAAIRWTWSTERVLRHVRALAPAPGAWTEVAGSVVVVLEACAAEEGPGLRGVLRALAPSEGVVLGERVLVRTADGAVTLLAAEIDGATATVRDLAALFLSRSSMR